MEKVKLNKKAFWKALEKPSKNIDDCTGTADNFKPKSDTYRLVHPDGTEDLTNFNPIEEARKESFKQGKEIGIREIIGKHNNNICCQGCYLLGKQSAEDIKQNQLADHFQAGRKEALQDVGKLINIPKLRKDFELRIERGCFDIEAFIFILQEIKKQIEEKKEKNDNTN